MGRLGRARRAILAVRARGKGGRYPKYTAKMDEKEFQRHIARTIIDSLMRDFPQMTMKVLKELLN